MQLTTERQYNNQVWLTKEYKEDEYLILTENYKSLQSKTSNYFISLDAVLSTDGKPQLMLSWV